MASRCSLAKTHRMEIRKALAVIRRSTMSRKQVCVKWVVGRDSNFSGLVFQLWTLAKTDALLPSHFREGRREASSNPKREGRREASSSPPVFSRGSRDNFFRENLSKKNEGQRRKKIIENGAKMIRRV